MENFPIKESPLDFDYILENNGYEIVSDFETHILFSKDIQIENIHSHKFKAIPIGKFRIEVSRMKILQGDGKYSICSPYAITFIYAVRPLHSIRRIKWDTFPGDIADVLDQMLKVVEAEAKICVYNFMETDAQIMQKLEKQ